MVWVMKEQETGWILRWQWTVRNNITVCHDVDEKRMKQKGKLNWYVEEGDKELERILLI